MLAVVLFTQFNIIPKTVEANSGSGGNINAYNGTTGGYTEPANLPYAGSVGRCGIVFYVADKDGNQYKLKGKKIPPIVLMDMSKKEEDKPISNTLCTTRCGAISFSENNIKEYPSKLPPPIEWDESTWTGNGKKIGEYLLEKSGQKTAYGVDIYNWEILLRDYGGSEWYSIIDDLHDGTKDITLYIETLSINYIYYKPMRVKVETFTKKQQRTLTYTKTATKASPQNFWGYGAEQKGSWVDSQGETLVQTDTYPSADEAYYLPMSSTDKPNVYFGTQAALATPGQSAESADLNNLVAQNKLGLLKTDVNNDATKFDTSVLKDESQQSFVEGARTLVSPYNYGTKGSGESARPRTEAEALTECVGQTFAEVWTQEQTLTYTRATVEPADDYIANYKWMQIVLPYSLCLKETQLGISKPSIANDTPVPFASSTISSGQGYGISMFNDQLVKAEINTYDGAHSPGNTEPPVSNKKGHNYVVKAYMTITKDTAGNIISEQPSGLYERKTKGDEADTVCNTININDEPNGFKLKNWWISDTYAQTDEPQIYNKDIPGSVRSNGTSPTQVQLEGTEENGGECLYLLLVKVITKELEDEGDTIKVQLEQSEITKKVDFNNSSPNIMVDGRNVLKKYQFIYKLDAYAEQQGICPGHNLENVDDRTDQSANSKRCTWAWGDKKLTYALKPNNPNSNIFVTKSNWAPIVTNGTGTYTTDVSRQKVNANRTLASNKPEIQSVSGWNLVTVIHRGEDPVTAFQWKNDKLNWTANTDLANIDGVTIANQKASNRKTSDYVSTTNLELVRNTALDDLSTTRNNSDNQGSGSSNPCDNSATRAGDLLKGDITEFMGVPTIKTNIFKVEVNYKVYSGNENYEGTDEVNNKVTKGTVDMPDLTISPYIFMRYQTTLGETGANQKQSAVLGNYDRTLKGMFSSAELLDNKDWDDGLMKLDSLQWSTHKRAEANHNISTVLSGGATFTLSVPSNNRKEVHLWTYQPVLVGDGEAMQKATKGADSIGKFSLDKAQENHKKAVTDVLEAMNNLRIEQYQNAKDLGKTNEVYLTEKELDTECVFDGTTVNSFNGKALSGDKKYYLQGNKGESNSPYIDARVIGTEEKYYTIFAKAGDGNLYIKESSDPSDCTADGGTPITDASVKDTVARIDKKTGIVTALKNALERKKGNDQGANGNGYNKPQWASNGKWYNEAFDGITMLECNTKFELGLVNTAERSSVLDPKLIPSSENGRETMLTKFHTAQFLTQDYSELGAFKGVTIPVKQGTTKHWLHSKLFYVPNATTQDLK